MGAFFTNVQLRATSAADLARVVSFLSSWFASEGLRAVEDDAPADRTVLLATSGDWTAVYDEATDTGAAELRTVAARLSLELGAAALAVQVHDSDVLDLELFDHGASTDRYCSAPEYFERLDDVGLQAVRGRPEAWRDLLVPNHDEPELARIFAEKLLFAEHTLHEVADCIGLERALASTGFRYTAEGHGPKVAATLRFRLAERPGYEARAEGLPRLAARYGMDRLGARPPTVLDLMMGSPAQLAAASQNLGGKSTGLEVHVVGDALDRGLVAVTSMNVVLGSPRERNFAEGTPEERREGERIRYVGAFPEARIPPGFVGDLDTLMRERPDKMIEIMHAANVHANVHLEARAEGEGRVRVTLVPHANPDSAYSEDLVVRVAHAAPRPLRAAPDLYPHQLVPLNGRGKLFLLVSFDATREDAAKFAVGAASEWAAVLGDPSALHVTVFHREPKLAPTSTHGFDWASLESTFRDTQVLVLATEPVGSESGSGLSFGTRILAPAEGDASLRPTLGLWIDVAEPDEGRRYEAILEGIAERAMTEAHGLQALVGRWGWVPTTNLETTPYEEACGIHGGTLTKAWLTRFVRGVAPGSLWLGSELVSRVDRAAVAALQATKVGDGDAVRISIADEVVAIRAVEEAIAPLLPSRDDWMAAFASKRG